MEIKGIVYIFTLVMLVRFAYTDTFKNRVIKNSDIIILGCVAIPYFIYRAATDFDWFLFLNPVVVWVGMAVILFGKMNAIGGGDVKVFLLMSLIMPWFDFYFFVMGASLLALAIHFLIARATGIPVKKTQSPFAISICMSWLFYILIYFKVI